MSRLESDAGWYRWRIDFDSMEALLRVFFESDYWRTVEVPPSGVEVHVVKAEESTVLAAEELDRLKAAEAAGPCARTWWRPVVVPCASILSRL